MYDKFAMELVWHNCETYPPEEFANDSLIITNGHIVEPMDWHRSKGYIILDEKYGHKILDYKHLKNWWWADIEQTVQDEVKFRE